MVTGVSKNGTKRIVSQKFPFCDFEHVLLNQIFANFLRMCFETCNTEIKWSSVVTFWAYFLLKLGIHCRSITPRYVISLSSVSQLFRYYSVPISQLKIPGIKSDTIAYYYIYLDIS